MFFVSSPSVDPAVSSQGPPVVTLDYQDDKVPPFGLSKFAPIHKQAGEKLQL